jgi:hypothetical protein
MSFEQAPHVDLNLPTPGLDNSSISQHTEGSSNGSALQDAKNSVINSEVSRRMKPKGAWTVAVLIS